MDFGLRDPASIVLYNPEIDHITWDIFLSLLSDYCVNKSHLLFPILMQLVMMVQFDSKIEANKQKFKILVMNRGQLPSSRPQIKLV